MRTAIVALICLVITVPAICDDQPQDKPAEISNAERDENGFLIHRVKSPYQAGETKIRLLLPDDFDPEVQYPSIYVLPVEAGDGNKYGDGLIEVKKTQLATDLQLIFVAPTFSALPWYTDHPTDRGIRQESHFLRVVLPFVEENYPVRRGRNDRLLLGFSKSGWGAWSLLLRNPGVFGRAAAWDAPLQMESLGKYGTTPIFGTEENFAEYRISDLLKQRAKRLQKGNRFVLTGYGSFYEHHLKTHELMKELKITHDYLDGPERKHDWHSGWVADAIDLLLFPRPDIDGE